MCGIAGLMRYPGDADERSDLVRRMGAAMRHRGPDDSGWFVDDDVALAVQRLSVIDLTTGHQPMSTPDGVHIVFNGEIFNYRELRDELARRGETFLTSSDTEVILRQYHSRGLEGFQALNGMFAVALWDTRSRQLHLVRDRMGVKPLYYYWDGRVFAFASEIKALVELPRIEHAVEPHAVWDYLTFRYVPAARTVWRHVFKLPPAHHLTISACGGPPQVSRWWDIPASDALAPQRSMAALIEEFGCLFRDAINRRMVADVPVGVLLSGGLDSSAVSAVAARSHGRKLKTFSVSFADSPATDERMFARRVAEHLGSEHQEVVIGQREFVEFLPRFVYWTDEPLADLASIPLYYVTKLARQTVTVALSGEGADEILAGYDFDRWLAARRLAQPDPADVRKDPVPPHMTNYMDSAAKRLLFRIPEDYPDSVDVLRGHLARCGARHPLDQMLFLYCQDWLVEDLLMKADKMSMANSLEVRTPFLDYRLVEWAAQAPVAAKVGTDRQGRPQTKFVLREFARDLLPDGIVTRPKQGFPVPVYEWLAGPLKGLARDLIASSDSRLRTWFDAGELGELLRTGVADEATAPDRHRLWHLMILELWLRAWRA